MLKQPRRWVDSIVISFLMQKRVKSLARESERGLRPFVRFFFSHDTAAVLSDSTWITLPEIVAPQHDVEDNGEILEDVD